MKDLLCAMLNDKYLARKHLWYHPVCGTTTNIQQLSWAAWSWTKRCQGPPEHAEGIEMSVTAHQQQWGEGWGTKKIVALLTQKQRLLADLYSLIKTQPTLFIWQKFSHHFFLSFPLPPLPLQMFLALTTSITSFWTEFHIALQDSNHTGLLVS